MISDPPVHPARRLRYSLLAHSKTREALFRAIRPTGNVLPGYTPSYAMTRVQEESL